MDFTLKTYHSLLCALQKADYRFYTFEEYCERKEDLSDSKFVILRHDVDEIASNALKIALLEHELGIRATYYFRIVKQSFDPDIIWKIVALGHEVGYHYEDLVFADGDMSKAIGTFATHLQEIRKFYPVRTVSMHGSSSSIYDNRTLWQHYRLADFNLIGEPYLTTDFRRVFYLTDTGYAWDGKKYAVRDVVEDHFGISFHTTQQIINCINQNEFPERCMILVHTLWTDSMWQWILLHLREFFKNRVKRFSRHNKTVCFLYSHFVKYYWTHGKSF